MEDKKKPAKKPTKIKRPKSIADLKKMAEAVSEGDTTVSGLR